MKMRKFLTLGLASALIVFATSCEEDEETGPVGPSLTVTETTSGSTGGDVTIDQGETLTFTWRADKGDRDLDDFNIVTTGANLTSTIPTSTSGNTFIYDISNDDDETYIDGVSFPNAGLNIGLTSYEFIVKDKGGVTQTVQFDVMVEASDIDLSAPQNFTWMRVGGADGTGLDQFGLSWTSNGSGSNAIIAVNPSTEMVILPSSTWTSITTQAGLTTAIDDATPVTQYTGVSATADNTYTDVLGVRHNGVDYILQIQTGTVSTVSGGTNITINGQYKN